MGVIISVSMACDGCGRSAPADPTMREPWEVHKFPEGWAQVTVMPRERAAINETRNRTQAYGSERSVEPPTILAWCGACVMSRTGHDAAQKEP